MSFDLTRFTSSLAPYLREFIEFRQTYGFVVNPPVYHLFRELDHYALWKDLSRADQIDENFAANWIFAVPRHSPGTKNLRLRHLRVFCDFLVRKGVMQQNPARQILYLRQPIYRPYIFPLAELHAMLQVAEGWKRDGFRQFNGWVMKTYVHLVYACGLRAQEALNLKLQDIDFEENTLSLWRTKFHKERLIPFSPRIGAVLREFLVVRNARFPQHSGPPDFVFCDGPGSYQYKRVLYLFHQLINQSGLDTSIRRRIHDLRHSFAVHRLYKWYQEGKDVLNKLPLLSTYMGHVGVEGTQVYLAATRALMREGNRRFQLSSEPILKKSIRRMLKNDVHR